MAVDETNIKFSDLYSIINNTTHNVESVSLSDFRGEGTVPTGVNDLISISLHFKGQTFSPQSTIYEYQSKTFQGNATQPTPTASVFTGLSKTNITAEQYTETPISWYGNIQINASIVKNAGCNDHFFILTSDTNKPIWSWGSTSNQYKIVWNCSTLTLYYPTGSENTPSASEYPRTYELKIIKADNFIKVYLDNAEEPVLQCSLNGNLADTFKIWIGADADDATTEAAEFNNVSVGPIPLYDFTSHTFTNCGATGQNGPTLENCRTTYNDPTPISWTSNEDYFNMTTQGIQEWTVPIDGTYKIEVFGASGGTPNSSEYWGIAGKGSKVEGEISLTMRSKLFISIGHEGYQSSTNTAFGGGGKGNTSSSNGTGVTGGGKSFVATTDTAFNVVGNNDNILFVAGGGGGPAGSTYPGWSIYAANGGDSDYTNGHNGSNSYYDNRPGGGGGTASSGGAGGGGGSTGEWGTGGDADWKDSDGIQGGGGGGGYYGGGGGGYKGGAGGGGSSFISSSITNPIGNTRTDFGYGKVIITLL